MKYEILLYYKYVQIDDPETFLEEQRLLCEKLGLSGRIIIAKEGINGTVEGTTDNTQKYIDALKSDERFKDMHFKRSEGTGEAFPKLSIKLRQEIVSLNLGDSDIDPNQTTGKYLQAEELHEWIHSNKEFYIVDMRNDYEHKVGFFADSILPNLKNFRDLPEVLPELEHLKHKTVVTVCTGGIRCEKASGFLVSNGFNDVYQLYGGIVTYMEKYPNEDFKGKLYVFDGRVTMGFNTEAKDHQVVAKCEKCDKASDNYVDCAYLHCQGHRHFICCNDCLAEDGNPYCSDECYEMMQQLVQTEAN